MHALRRFPCHAPLTLMLMFIAVGCPHPDEPLSPEDYARVTSQRLEPFASESDFQSHLEQVKALRVRAWGSHGARLGCGSSGVADDVPLLGGAADEPILNDREKGLDEGDLVKTVGDDLVLLRRGRLFTVHQGEGAQALTPVDREEASAPGFTRGTWYDELLVYGQRVIVLGHSETLGATEVGLFRLGKDGRLTHESSHFLRSNNYFSRRDYASRLVGGSLFFYINHVLDDENPVPTESHWQRGDEITGWSPVLAKTDIYRPLQPTLSPVLHTVVRCELDAPAFTCSARAVMGPYSHLSHVSRDAVYVWVEGNTHQGAVAAARAPVAPDPSYVYRLPLEGGAPTALRAWGSPTGPSAFRENGDGHLEVMLTMRGSEGFVWTEPPRGEGPYALLRAPLSSFAAVTSTPEGGRYTRLPGPSGDALSTRFVGDSLLWGDRSGSGAQAGQLGQLWVTGVRSPEAVQELALAHDVERLEALGSTGAMVVGRDGTRLRFTSLALGASPELRGQYTLLNASPGELDRQGFFFKPDATGGGVLGLPARLEGGSWSSLPHGSAELTFLRVDSRLGLRPLGSVRATTETRSDACVKSCSDWYGNARPVFSQGRVFSLLGYELVETQLGQDSLQESFRADFLAPSP